MRISDWSSDVCSSDLAGDYIAHGFRHRAAELATEWLGPRTELEIQQTLQREVAQERWTSLDRTLQREAGEDGRVQKTEEHTSELQSLMRNSYAVFCLKKKKQEAASYNQTLIT